MRGVRFLARRWLLVLFCLCLTLTGRAQSDADLVQARKLYAQGLTQEAAGDWAGALQTFEDVARIKATPQVRFHVARCKEQLGRFNEALGGYRMAEYEAEQAGPKERALVDEVKKARESLEAKIPRVTIVRGKGADSIRIELDGVVLGDTQIGQPITLDPGPHVLTGVVQPGKSFKRTLTLAQGDDVRVALDVPDELTTSPPRAAPEPAPPREKPPEPAPPAGAPADVPAQPSSSAMPWIIGGLGVASLGASVVFYTQRKKAEDELEQGCIGRTCPDTLKSTQQRGETYAALSGVALGVGIVGVGASVLMLLGRSTSAPKAPAASLHLGARSASVSFGGSF